MVRFSKFTEYYYGHVIHVNPELVRAVRPNPSGDPGTEIKFATDHKIHVKELVPQTVKALEDASRLPKVKSGPPT